MLVPPRDPLIGFTSVLLSCPGGPVGLKPQAAMARAASKMIRRMVQGSPYRVWSPSLVKPGSAGLTRLAGLGWMPPV